MSETEKTFSIEYLQFMRDASGVAIDCNEIAASGLVRMAYHGFGERPKLVASEPSSDAYDDVSLDIPNPHVFCIKDCLVHTQYGLVTLGDQLARESTSHFPSFKFPDIKFSGRQHYETSVVLPPFQVSATLDYAISAQAGVQDNYYHWLVLFLPRIDPGFIVDEWANRMKRPPVVILPRFVSDVQRASAAAILDHYELAHICLEESTSIVVNNLIYPSVHRHGGIRPHPMIKSTFDILKRRFYKSGLEYPKKVYISRRDSGNRTMVNELEVEQTLKDNGYSIFLLSGMTLGEQINLFVRADTIVGGHGAGLTNIGFCEPGARVLEIAMPSYQNWCYRRLASVVGVEYGFMYGTQLAAPGGGSIHAQKFSVDICAIARILEAGSF
jgi:hypothetical protein